MSNTTTAPAPIHIVSRWDATRVLFTFHPTIEQQASGRVMRYAVEAAVANGADLSDANLRGANLSDADMSDADMGCANLSGANMRRANMSDANLRGADMGCASLRGANLCSADICGANLSDADLRGIDLHGANLRGANLQGANLGDANLQGAKTDYFDVLLHAPHEVSGLRKALIDGRVDGSTYEGECACLVGTIANVRGAPVDELDDIQPDSSRPIERFFMNIRKGDTPENNPCSALAVQWLDEFTALLGAATTPKEQAAAGKS